MGTKQRAGLDSPPFPYTYDFEDDWQHRMEIEERLPTEFFQEYPVCVDGERSCPPEDNPHERFEIAFSE